MTDNRNMMWEQLPPELQAISDEWFKMAVKEHGLEEAQKQWAHATDPVTGYVCREHNQCNLLNNEQPCMRCGGFGLIGSLEKGLVLCARCWDDWSSSTTPGDGMGAKLLRKHGYVSSKKKWHAAFAEFCSMKPA